MTARIFIWVGHPRSASLSHGLADAYRRGAKAHGAEIRRMHLSDMVFDADLTEGYHSRKTLEPCLEEWRAHTTWANHVCWAYPQWWGGMPAKMKGVVDRAFLPGFAMRYRENDPWWDRSLTGRCRCADDIRCAAPVRLPRLWTRGEEAGGEDRVVVCRRQTGSHAAGGHRQGRA